MTSASAICIMAQKRHAGLDNNMKISKIKDLLCYSQKLLVKLNLSQSENETQTSNKQTSKCLITTKRDLNKNVPDLNCKNR